MLFVRGQISEKKICNITSRNKMEKHGQGNLRYMEGGSYNKTILIGSKIRKCTETIANVKEGYREVKKPKLTSGLSKMIPMSIKLIHN